jgi:hypothetical protein
MSERWAAHCNWCFLLYRVHIQQPPYPILYCPSWHSLVGYWLGCFQKRIMLLFQINWTARKYFILRQSRKIRRQSTKKYWHMKRPFRPSISLSLSFPYEKYTYKTHMWNTRVHMWNWNNHIWFTYDSHVIHTCFTCGFLHVFHMWFTCESYVNHMWLFQFHMWNTCETHVYFS